MSSIPLSVQLIRLLVERRQRGLPAQIRHQTKLHIADSIGIAFAAARRDPLAGQLVQAISAGAGQGICRVIGRPESHAASLAAFANSALIHILDFDDIHDAARLHPTVVTLPAALAAAALVDDAPAARLVDAVALGNELICRLGVMCSPTGKGPGSDWFLTQLFGYMGASLAAGIMLDLPEATIVSSFGLAYMQAAGGKEAGFGVGSTARAIYPAFAAMGGTHASLLARAGIAGPRTALDGAAGLFKIYLGAEPDAAQHDTLLDAERWYFTATQTKPWPSCRLSHPYVAAALDVRARLDNASIERIVVKVNGSASKLCSPIAERRRPQTLQDAKYSIPYMTAFTLAHGTVSLETLNTGALGDAFVHELADRIDIQETLPDNPGHPPAEISVHTRDGRCINSEKTLRFDMSAADIQRKFGSCIAYAGAGEQAEELWHRLMHIDDEKNVDFLFV
jgi:2-methylcitrate dehydratase PrpD